MPTNTRAYGQASQLGNTPAASNPVLNSAFQVWQRGTSFTATTSYGADRWYQVFDSGIAATYSRQNTNDTTNLPNIQYCMRVQRDSGNTGASPKQITLSQSLESANSIPLAGKTVTYSFYARAGANYSPTSSILVATLYSGTGTDQNVMAGFTGNASVASTNATLTTTWQRFSVTGTVATTAKQLAVYFVATPTGTAGANDYFEVTGVQLDIGSVALPFRTYSATLAGELAACQRYYFKVGPGTENNAPIAMGMFNSAGTSVQAQVYFPQQLRIKPSSIDSLNLRAQDISNGYAMTSVTLDASSSASAGRISATVSGATAFRSCFIDGGTGAGYLAFNAEL
jgi:hypothetical protein